MKKLIIRAIFCFLLISNLIYGETYYINKNSGKDSNNGLSPDQAWENVEKVNGFTFSPGDSVLFSRGSTWNFTFYINSSGTEGNPIYYGAYGEGRKPTFDMQFKKKTIMMLAKNQQYGIIENMVFQNSNRNPPDHANGVFFENSHHFYVNNIEIYKSGNVSLAMQEGSSDIHLDSIVVMYGENNGILSHGHVPPSNNLTVENCYVSHIRYNDCYVIHEGWPNNAKNGENFIFRNNYAEASWEEGFDITSGSGFIIDNNITNSNKNGAFNLGHSAKNITITNHIAYADKKVSGAGRVNMSGLGNITFKGNLIFGSGVPMLLLNTDNINITHNTFVWEGVYSDGVMIQWDADSVTFKNNILATADEFYGRIAVKDNISLSNKNRYDFDYNIYFGKWPDFLYGSSFHNLATWRNTFNQDSNSVVRDPFFVDKYLGNFTLSDSSWAIDKADSSNRYGEVDMLGTPIPYGVGADIGAFEFKPGVVYTPPATPAAPDNLTLEIITDNRVKLSWNDNSDNEFGFHIMRAVDDGSQDDFNDMLDDEGFGHFDFTEANATEYIDSTSASATVEYRYRVKAINNKGNSAYTNIVEFIATDVKENLAESIVSEFALLGNYPNPFNPSTTIKYQIPKSANVKISIYNAVGELVKILFKGSVSAGSHSVTWNATDKSGNSVTSGVYFYRIDASTNSAPSFIQTKKMLLLK